MTRGRGEMPTITVVSMVPSVDEIAQPTPPARHSPAPRSGTTAAPADAAPVAERPADLVLSAH